MIKALAVRQPWATLIARGWKSIEVRTWHTKYRGPLVIVASARPNEVALAEWLPKIPSPRIFPTSGLVALVDLVDIRPLRFGDSRRACFSVRDAVEHDDSFAWVLENPRRLEPVPYTKSRVMTFDISENLVRVA